MQREFISQALEHARGDWFAKGSFCDAYYFPEDFIVKRYTLPDFECSHPLSRQESNSRKERNLIKYGNAEWEYILTQHVRALGARVPENYGIILSPSAEVHAVFENIPRPHAPNLLTELKWRVAHPFASFQLFLQGVCPVDSTRWNVRFKENDFYFIDLVRWRIDSYFASETYETLKEKYPPKVFLEDGTQVKNIEKIIAACS